MLRILLLAEWVWTLTARVETANRKRLNHMRFVKKGEQLELLT